MIPISIDDPHPLALVSSVYLAPTPLTEALNRESRIARQPLVSPHRLELSPAQALHGLRSPRSGGAAGGGAAGGLPAQRLRPQAPRGLWSCRPCGRRGRWAQALHPCEFGEQKLCKAGAVYLGYRAWQGWRSRIRRRGGPWRELERGVEPGSPRSEEALGICAPIQDDVESSE